MSRIQLKGNQTGQRSHQRAQPTDIHSQQQGPSVFGERRQHHGSRDIADALAEQKSAPQFTALCPCGDRLIHRFHPAQISHKDKEKHKGQQQPPVHSQKRAAGKEQQHSNGDPQQRPFRNHPQNRQKSQQEQCAKQHGALFLHRFFTFLSGKYRPDFFRWNQLPGGQQQKKTDSHSGKNNRKKFGRIQLIIAVEIQVLRVPHRGCHAAQIGSDGHQNHGYGCTLGANRLHHRNAQRNKGEQRHIVGQQHRTKKAQQHQGNPQPAGGCGPPEEKRGHPG